MNEREQPGQHPTGVGPEGLSGFGPGRESEVRAEATPQLEAETGPGVYGLRRAPGGQMTWTRSPRSAASSTTAAVPSWSTGGSPSQTATSASQEPSIALLAAS
jgi:hypothetical protein